MKKCIECGSSQIRTEQRDHRYVECGLENIVIRNATFRICTKCGAEFRGIRAIDNLHQTIAHILASKESKLSKQEVRFLRQFLGYSNRDFADLIGMSESQTSRWTSTTQPDEITPTAERFLRLLVLGKHTPCTDYMLKDLRQTGIEPFNSADMFVENKRNEWKLALAS